MQLKYCIALKDNLVKTGFKIASIQDRASVHANGVGFEELNMI